MPPLGLSSPTSVVADVDNDFDVSTTKNDNNNDELLLISKVSKELEIMKQQKQLSSKFPYGCYELMLSLPGNNKCIDCGKPNPQWASISYGILLCLNCSGCHRSLGVRYSKVRSITLDHWSPQQILHMLEGGNEQMTTFFQRHSLFEEKKDKYKTKAARFYCNGLQQHCTKLISLPCYRGRNKHR